MWLSVSPEIARRTDIEPVPEYIEIKELAGLLQLRPFKVVAEVLALGIFRHADELVDFSTASAIAAKHGVTAEPLL